ncbi:hypothetical protein KQX54_021210 [Cotesia glomerata]|uniref:Uncharacterized protein n=1 Tax=Cotesia glomerata TaxID=32391 RepID=A0AAV7J920_COTGL|nr:hypothetical protein KQX54_021210 [Cotesia glomerata]
MSLFSRDGSKRPPGASPDESSSKGMGLTDGRALKVFSQLGLNLDIYIVVYVDDLKFDLFRKSRFRPRVNLSLMRLKAAQPCVANIHPLHLTASGLSPKTAKGDGQKEANSMQILRHMHKAPLIPHLYVYVDNIVSCFSSYSSSSTASSPLSTKYTSSALAFRFGSTVATRYEMQSSLFAHGVLGHPHFFSKTLPTDIWR